MEQKINSKRETKKECTGKSTTQNIGKESQKAENSIPQERNTKLNQKERETKET